MASAVRSAPIRFEAEAVALGGRRIAKLPVEGECCAPFAWPGRRRGLHRRASVRRCGRARRPARTLGRRRSAPRPDDGCDCRRHRLPRARTVCGLARAGCSRRPACSSRAGTGLGGHLGRHHPDGALGVGALDHVDPESGHTGPPSRGRDLEAGSGLSPSVLLRSLLVHRSGTLQERQAHAVACLSLLLCLAEHRVIVGGKVLACAGRTG